jgi:hypothetical protein
MNAFGDLTNRVEKPGLEENLHAQENQVITLEESG